MKITIELDIQGDAESVDKVALLDRVWYAVDNMRKNEGLTGEDENAFVRGVGAYIAEDD